MKKLLFVIGLFGLALLTPACGSKRSAVDTPVIYGPASSEEQDVGDVAAKVVREARLWIGTQYKYGKNQRGVGTDCSGMVMVIFKKVAGIELPRNSAAQQEFCQRIGRSDLRAGDLVFFKSGRRSTRVSHVGIYIGNGRFIHASSSRGVMESSLEQEYYVSHFHSAGRVLKENKRKKQRREMVAEPVENYRDTLIRAEIELDSLINALSDGFLVE